MIATSFQVFEIPSAALCNSLQATFKETEKSFHRFLMKIGRRLKNERAEYYSFDQPLAQLLNLPYHELCEQINLLSEQVDQFIDKAPAKIQRLVSPLKVFKSQLREFVNDLNHIFETRNEDHAYWITD